MTVVDTVYLEGVDQYHKVGLPNELGSLNPRSCVSFPVYDGYGCCVFDGESIAQSRL